MILKRLFLAVALSMAVSFVTKAADDADYLHIRTSSGWEVLSLDRVDRLTFSSTTMTALSASGATVATFPRESLEMMYFNDSSGVETIAGEESDRAFVYDAASSMAVMLRNGDFKVYSVDGRILVDIPEVKAGEYVNLSALPAGPVIIKSGNNAVKVMR